LTQKEKHMQALSNFTEHVKGDPNVIALLLSGSLSYGTVWEKSDIDLTMLVRDGSVKGSWEYCVDGDGIEMHVLVKEVADFKNEMQKQRGGGYPHTYFGKGTMVFSKDETLTEFFEDVRHIGAEDAILSFCTMASFLLVDMYRVEKWITVFKDPVYSQRFLQQCCLAVADMILLLHGELPTRESVLRAMELNPALMREVYVVPSTTAMTEEDIRHVLKLLDGFLTEHMDKWSKPLLRYFSDGEVKKVSECMKHFNAGSLNVALAYLAAKGVLERVTLPSRVFKHSKLTVEEIAYFYVKKE